MKNKKVEIKYAKFICTFSEELKKLLDKYFNWRKENGDEGKYPEKDF